MKTIIYLLITLICSNYISAQTGTVHIEQDDKINQLLTSYKTHLKKNTDYYRVQVGFGSHDKAQKIKADVELDFPTLPISIDFDSPTYRVRVGKFKNKLTAERKFIEIRKKYPDAMLLKPKKSTK